MAPTKTKLSIPRKKFNGIVLLFEKLIYIAEALNIKKDQMFGHTDSLVSMHWISKNKNNLKITYPTELTKYKNQTYKYYSLQENKTHHIFSASQSLTKNT